MPKTNNVLMFPTNVENKTETLVPKSLSNYDFGRVTNRGEALRYIGIYDGDHLLFSFEDVENFDSGQLYIIRFDGVMMARFITSLPRNCVRLRCAGPYQVEETSRNRV